MAIETKLYWLYTTKEKLNALKIFPESECYDINDKGLAQVSLTEEQAKSLIPDDTHYCYARNELCPFWDRIESFPKQSNGFCHFMKSGDDAQGGLLWDMCKECGIKEDFY